MKNPGIYILTSPSGKQYVGKDSNLPRRVRDHLSGNAPNCRAIHDAIQKYGRDAFSVEIIQYPGISEEALKSVERWWIQRLQTLSPSGYNLLEGGDGLTSKESKRINLSRVADGTHHFLGPENNRKRVEDGTHHFLDREFQRENARKNNRKRVEDGTHHFLDREFARKNNRKRVEDGTHNFLDREFQRRNAKKRVAEGTHNLLGDSNPAKHLIKEGRHNFQDPEIQRRAKINRDATNHKRMKDGTHNFLGDSNPSHKRVAEGTHHLLGDSNPIRHLAKEGRHPRTIKRLKAEWCYIIALSRFWYEIHDYTLKRRAEFLSKEIPDLSNAEQTYLF